MPSLETDVAVLEGIVPETPAPAPRFPGAPLLGHYLAFRDDPVRLFLDAMRAEGDLVRVPVAYKTLFLLSGPAAFRHCLVTNHRNYSRRRAPSAKAIRGTLGGGLLTDDGDEWVKHRRAAQSSFRPTGMERLVPETERLTRRRLDRWEGKTDGALELARELMELTAQVSFSVVFDYELSDAEARQFVDDFLGLQAHLYGRMSNPLKPPSMNAARQRKRIEELRDRLAKSAATEAIASQAMTLLAAAPENPSNLLAWALYLLALHPDALRELRSGLAAGDLTAMSRVFDETLRLYPGAWAFERRAEQEDRIEGYRIPAGSTVVLCPLTMQRNPAYWRDPDVFRPERFRGGCQSDAYLPFGAGPRRCIGERFGVIMAEAVLPALVERFDIQLDSAERGASRPMFTLRPRTGVLARLKRVTSP